MINEESLLYTALSLFAEIGGIYSLRLGNTMQTIRTMFCCVISGDMSEAMIKITSGSDLSV